MQIIFITVVSSQGPNSNYMIIDVCRLHTYIFERVREVSSWH